MLILLEVFLNYFLVCFFKEDFLKMLLLNLRYWRFMVNFRIGKIFYLKNNNDIKLIVSYYFNSWVNLKIYLGKRKNWRNVNIFIF